MPIDNLNMHIPSGIMLWCYPAIMERVIDGDTFQAKVDLGHYTYRVERYRLLGSEFGINTFELNSPDPGLRQLAQEAKEFVQRFLPVGSGFYVVTSKPTGANDPKDGFGRFLAQAILQDGRNVGDMLLGEGLATIYERKK